MKALLTFVSISMISAASIAAPSFVTYNCELAKDATARHGVETLHLSFEDGTSFSRVAIAFFKRNAEGHYETVGGAPGVYAHISNIQTGRYAGFKKFKPSVRFTNPEALTEKFSEVALQENENRTSAVVAFPESKNAVYNCR